MPDQYGILVNTHSSLKDVWPLFYGSLVKWWPDHPRMYVLSDCFAGLQGDFVPVIYDTAASFSEQYLQGLQTVEEPFCLTLQEDYVLNGKVDEDALSECVLLLQENPALHFVRLIRSGRGQMHEILPGIHLLGTEFQPRYSMQASLWRTEVLKILYENLPPLNPWQAEVTVNASFGHLLNGALSYRGEPVRGGHYDSSVFPYFATALVKGRWNVSEYPELLQVLNAANIDVYIRGIR